MIRESSARPAALLALVALAAALGPARRAACARSRVTKAAVGLGPFVEGFGFDLKPCDPRVLGASAVLLALVALAAALGPARRAAVMDPMSALRTE